MGSLLCLKKQRRPYDKERGEKRRPELVMTQKFMQVDTAPMLAWAVLPPPRMQGTAVLVTCHPSL